MPGDDGALQDKIRETIGKVGVESTALPELIIQNLRHELRWWQEGALKHFVAYKENKNLEVLRGPRDHLMFNMATGSGKTLLMAACILYYYSKGYSRFLFTTSRVNIVDKTWLNFGVKDSPKYLFNDRVEIDGRDVPVECVESFSDIPLGIEIKMASIQGLHDGIHEPREDRDTLGEICRDSVVVIADEAHHLNARTGGSRAALEENWESTVDKILDLGPKEKPNALLEFTATIPASREVQEKYRRKTIYTFPIESFIRSGHSKNINLVSTKLDKRRRFLLALCFNWYRHRLAMDSEIKNFKPVILFKSARIKDSEADGEEFLSLCESVKASDFGFLSSAESLRGQMTENQGQYNHCGWRRTAQMIEFMTKLHNGDLSRALSDVSEFIRSNFEKRHVIITNMRRGDPNDGLLNTLEDPDNHIRAIFTVNRLTEGWDVQNLYDIVRLYETKSPARTLEERQLIGRGIRYCAFPWKGLPADRRKFEGDLNEPLGILEELCYHSNNELSYIKDLKKALEKLGYVEGDREQVTIRLKDFFVKSRLYRDEYVWLNEREPQRRAALEELGKTVRLNDCVVSLDKLPGFEPPLEKEPKPDLTVGYGEVERHVFRKAMNRIASRSRKSLARFRVLADALNVEGMDDFFRQLKACHFVLRGGGFAEYSDMPVDLKVKVVERSLSHALGIIDRNTFPEKGGEFARKKISKVFDPEREVSKKKFTEERPERWCATDEITGTSEEIALVHFIEREISTLHEMYDRDSVFLLRNDEAYKIYDFKTARGFMPDFLLFLKTAAGAESQHYYQIMIECKGDWGVDEDGGHDHSAEGWKQEFLEEITRRYGPDSPRPLVAENRKYRIVGLPFFQESRIDDFSQSFRGFVSSAEKAGR